MNGLNVIVFLCVLCCVSCSPMTERFRRDTTTTEKPLVKSTSEKYVKIETLVDDDDEDDVIEEAVKPIDIMMSSLKYLFKYSKKAEEMTVEDFQHVKQMATKLKIDALAIGKVAEGVAKWAKSRAELERSFENMMLPSEFKKADETSAVKTYISTPIIN